MTGLFFPEPQLDMDESQTQLLSLFNKLQDASVASGYRVLFEDGGSSSMQPLGEDAKIQAARATEYADFRSKRRLMEAINMG